MPLSGRTVFLLAVALCLAQAGAIGSSIYRYEAVLAHGERHLFKAAPIDPYDPFRGRYVALAQENLRFPVTEEEGKLFERGRVAWARIERGEDGFSRFSGISPEPSGLPEVRVRVEWSYRAYNGRSPEEGSGATKEKPHLVQIAAPFNRFYMNEKKAPRAETAYRKASRSDAYLAVRIRDGVGVIEDLYIGGKPISLWLQEDEGK